MKVCCLLFAFLFAVSCSKPSQPVKTEEVKAETTFELPTISTLGSSDLAPVRTAIGGKTLVMLGESIHLTSEFPRVRDMLVRNLHESGEFSLLLFDGSPVDFWIAEEEYLSSTKDVLSGADFQKNALLALWQTDEIRSVIDYALRSQTGIGRSDLYLSSYDVQIGQGRRFARGRSVFETLVGLLKKRDRRVPAAEEEAILFLEGLVGCEKKGFPESDEQYAQAEQGIGALARVAALTGRNSENDLHEKALTLLPKMVGYSLQFCREVKETTRDSAEARDDWASRQFIDLFSTMNQKAMVWAHSSEIRQSLSKGERMSFGAYVRSAFPDQTFAIHFTAGSGRAIAFTDAKGSEIQPIETALLPLDRVSLEQKLSRLSRMDFFVASQSLPSDFGIQETTRWEPGGFITIDPRKDFDGYYFVQEITGPRLK